MTYLNLHIPTTLRSPEFLGCEPIDQATWLKLCAYCCDQENGGVIADCSDWGDRRWMATCTCSKAEVARKCQLWQWDSQSLTVWHYPMESQRVMQAKREGGKQGSLSRWNRTPIETPIETPYTERKGKGKEKVMEGELNTGVASAPKVSKFIKPTPEELKFQCAKIGLPESEGERFFNYYESNGWRVGKNPMRSWTCAMQNWKIHWDENRGGGNGRPQGRGTPVTGPDDELIRDLKRMGNVAAQFGH
jgi:hypothetical protein